MKQNPAGQVLTVAAFTFKEAVRKKAFWVTNIIFVVLILGACIILPKVGGGASVEIPDLSDPESIATLEDSFGAGAGETCYIANESGFLKDAGEALGAALMLNMNDISPDAPEMRSQALEQVKNNGGALVEISADDPPQITITTKDFMSSFPTQAVAETLNNLYRVHQFELLGYDAMTSATIVSSALPLEMKFAAATNMSNYIAGMALMLVMFMTIYLYGYGVAMSIASEKSTRVMETLIVSAKPARILVGKCIGMGAVGLAQLVGMLLFSAGSAKLLVPAGGFGQGIQLPELTFGKAALLVVYFLLGYALFSMINSMCGAMVNKMEDLQSAMTPAALISVLSFYGGYVTMGVTPTVSGGVGGTAGNITMLIPFTAPFAAPSMLLSGALSAGTIAASLGILLVTIVLVSIISGKVYSASVLHYGGRLKFGDVRKMIKNK